MTLWEPGTVTKKWPQDIAGVSGLGNESTKASNEKLLSNEGSQILKTAFI